MKSAMHKQRKLPWPPAPKILQNTGSVKSSEFMKYRTWQTILPGRKRDGE